MTAPATPFGAAAAPAAAPPAAAAPPVAAAPPAPAAAPPAAYPPAAAPPAPAAYPPAAPPAPPVAAAPPAAVEQYAPPAPPVAAAPPAPAQYVPPAPPAAPPAAAPATTPFGAGAAAAPVAEPAPAAAAPTAAPAAVPGALPQGLGFGGSDPFSAPSGISGEKITQFEGHLLLVKPKEIIPQMTTKRGVAEGVVKADLLVLSGDRAYEVLPDILVFQTALKRELTDRLAQKAVNPLAPPYLLGRLGKSAPKEGKDAAWIFTPYSENDYAVAKAWTDAHPGW